MNSQILSLIIEQLNQYLISVGANAGSPTEVPAIFGNIAKTKLAGGRNNTLDDKIVVSLVNVSEEGSLKNKPERTLSNTGYVEVHPKVYLNLFLLFAANYEDYLTAIDHLLQVVAFFQSTKEFHINQAISKNTPADTQQVAKVNMDIHTLNFEQLNDLWGSLGGKQVPFVLYRARVISVMAEKQTASGSLIQEIELITDNSSN